MMCILLVLFLCCTSSAFSASRDSVMRLRTSISPVLAYPLGQFSYGHSQRFLTGQCLPSWGGSIYMSYLVRPRFSLGLSFTDVVFRLHKDKVYEQITRKYFLPGYDNTINLNYCNFELPSLAIVVSHIVYTPIVDIEPYVHVGVGIPNSSGIADVYSIDRKKLNENYSEELSQDMLAKPFFFPALGFRLNKRITPTVYFFAAAQYQYGELRYTFVDAGVDFLGNTSKHTEPVYQPVSVMQLKLGIDIRVINTRPFHSRSAIP